MAWIIEKTTEITEGNVSLPIQSANWNDETSDKKCIYPFRLLDDDGEVYYYGRSSNSSSFSALDNFGMPNDGCTDIQYLENGKWESL